MRAVIFASCDSSNRVVCGQTRHQFFVEIRHSCDHKLHQSPRAEKTDKPYPFEMPCPFEKIPTTDSTSEHTNLLLHHSSLTSHDEPPHKRHQGGQLCDEVVGQRAARDVQVGDAHGEPRRHRRPDQAEILQRLQRQPFQVSTHGQHGDQEQRRQAGGAHTPQTRQVELAQPRTPLLVHGLEVPPREEEAAGQRELLQTGARGQDRREGVRVQLVIERREALPVAV